MVVRVPHTRRNICAPALLLALAIAVGACSSEKPELADQPAALANDVINTTSASTAAPPPTSSTAPPPTSAPDEPIVTTTSVEVAAEDELVRRPETNPGTNEGNHWLGRNQMSDDLVELVWSPVEGSAVTYRIYRTKITAALDREALELTPELLIFEGSEPDVSIFVDTQVESGTFYTYILSVEADGVLLDRRWANALTVTDTDPPTPITDLSGELINGEVVLRWEPSSDNVEFAAYAVSTVDAEGKLTYLGGGADQALSSFLDTRPDAAAAGSGEPGTITYAVQAVDFHDNRTEPALITIVLK